ncbi:hypothetical protein SAMN05216353_11751 [Halobacillus alkaliphilus]|uniref:Uncharacterized protein n=1 Tax=Halobacillus alkaliphilus TaxID=396056 RepID=A0A1I2N5Y9_9BACI|nr:hypothetical protein [Halobacillus alkaliphilus]SFF98868.1 hypothetical protein SAMN05216353_11751 [Halobacillus alkaliphilus]
MRSVDSKKKINFIKSYWLDTLNINVYKYDENKLSNLNTYLLELTNVISSIKMDNSKYEKKKFGLVYIVEDLYSYLKQNIYFVKHYNKHGEIDYLSKMLERVLNAKNKENIKKQVLELEKLASNLQKIQENNIKLLFNELIYYIYSSVKLEDTYEYVKSLVMDLVIEIILDGYPIEYLIKEVYKETEFDFSTMSNYSLSLKEQFENKRTSFTQNKKMNKYTFIFRIDNLKSIQPFTIKGYTFYNPLRESHNRYFKNINTLFAEEGLMRKEEVEYLRNSPRMGKQDRSFFNIVQHTDLHVRVNTRHWNEIKAKQEVLKELEEIVTYIRFVYDISNIRVSEKNVTISGLKKSYPLWRDGRNIDKYLATNYRDLNIFRNKINELEDEDNLINKLFRVNDNSRQYLLNSLNSFHLGIDQSSTVNKFHHYWISAESLLANKKVGNIKSEIINTYSEHLTYYYYYIELVDIYNMIFAEFKYYYHNKETQKIEFPNEISSIEDLGDFYNYINLRVFSQNLRVFPEYIRNEYLIYRIDKFASLNENIETRVKFNARLKKTYQRQLSKIYSLRNQMFHNGSKDYTVIGFYTDWLESLLHALFGTIRNNLRDDGISNEGNYLDINYEQFVKFLRNSPANIIEFYISD